MTLNDIKEIYILKADGDGTMRSTDDTFGVAVDNIDEAIRFVEEGGIGYTHSFEKIVIFSNKDDACTYAFRRKDFENGIIHNFKGKDKWTYLDLIKKSGYS